MGTIEIESTILIPCGRPEVYAFCVDPQARSAVPGQEDQVPPLSGLVPDRSWTESLESGSETITWSYVVYPVADSTRMTVTAQYAPKGLGRMFSGAKEGAYRKQEAARLAALKKAVERHVRLGNEGLVPASCAVSGCFREVERLTGIEPAYQAWEASALPLSYSRSAPICAGQNLA